jgi:HPr kinase/phosphorylase
MKAAGQTIHATAVSVNGYGVLLIGPSGSGKSDLALRLIDRGAVLICDDCVIVNSSTPAPTLEAAPNIAGMIELRGIGILKLPFVDNIPLRLCAILGKEPERMPYKDAVYNIAGTDIPSVALNAYTASAPIKVELALKSILR